MSSNHDNPVMTAKEASLYLRISRQKIYELLKSGQVIGRNMGTAEKPNWRVHRSALDKFLTEPPQEDVPSTGGTNKRRSVRKRYLEGIGL